MDSQIDYWTARTLLEWQVELGVTEAISETPVDRFALDVKPPAQKPTQPAPVAPVVAPDIDPVAIAKTSAANATSLEALKSAVAGFPHCELQRGAHNLVFADGSPSARVMVIGEFPSREDDLQGLPFAGRAGALLDKMFAAIAMARSADGAAGVYLTTALPWRPPRLPPAATTLMPQQEGSWAFDSRWWAVACSDSDRRERCCVWGCCFPKSARPMASK